LDPFVASLPFIVGAWLVYRSWRGRYRVHEFRGACPRCDDLPAVKMSEQPQRNSLQ
jgi:hypothetical protein